MFEVGFQELFLLGVIALLVVGPERLPGLARTVGVWVGKAQRLVGQVRADVERELRAEEIRQSMKEFSPADALSDMRKEVEEFTGEVSRPVTAAEDSAGAGAPVKAGGRDEAKAGSRPPDRTGSADTGRAGDAQSSEPSRAGAADAAGPEPAPEAASAPRPATESGAGAANPAGAAEAGTTGGSLPTASMAAASAAAAAAAGPAGAVGAAESAAAAEAGTAGPGGPEPIPPCAGAPSESAPEGPVPAPIERDERAAVS